ncbi:MAG: hypothetical protein KF773_33690 [Deltaproteobacteria bacterium]|nr:hypothetical protein [Deltaproteobacteria bacterium]
MKRVLVVLASVSLTGGIARAQPVPDLPLEGGTEPSQPPLPPDPKPAESADGDHREPAADPYAPLPPPKPEKPLPPIYMPEVLTTPTGWLLPAAVLYSRTSLDTGGGVTSDHRFGLGDVAEFGVATTDAVRERMDDRDLRATRIQPYVTASFRLGVSEDRLFVGQPGVTLGFRKSFERNHNGFKTRIAELTLVASKNVTPRFAVHIGGAFWDASLEGIMDEATEANPEVQRREVSLHDQAQLADQVRVFGGLQIRPLDKSSILVDVGWAPEFCYRCSIDDQKIRLRPVLSWGVRYEVARWVRLEAGVRVPDIDKANLLDAQIFGQLSFTSWALRRAVDSLK